MSGYGFTSGGTSYDFEDRLTGYARAATSGSAVLSQSWSLTSVGDWSSTTINGTAQSRTHGSTHELLTAGGSSVTTDVKGNMTSIPATLREAGASTAMNLVWDFDNRLKSVDTNANSTADVTYEYDALGRRVARTDGSGATVFVQADQQTLADYPKSGSASSAAYRYVYGSYIDEPVVRKTSGSGGTILYYHRNQQYSIYALSDSSGTISERYAYTAYGQPTFLNASGTVQSSSAANNRYTYTAREWDQTTGLHYFRARWMSGISGRFLTRDPIGFEGSKWDLYFYSNDSPPKFVDFAGTKNCVPECGCGNGGEIDDKFGNHCCKANACNLAIAVQAPCRSVQAQILHNILAGNSPHQGIVTGHAFLGGSCTKYSVRGFYPTVQFPTDPITPVEGGLINDRGHDFTHSEELGPVCRCTMGCIASRIGEISRTNPPYVLNGGDPDFGLDGGLNCTTFVTRTLAHCGFPLDTSIEPFQLARRPGMIPNPQSNCLNDRAAR